METQRTDMEAYQAERLTVLWREHERLQEELAALRAERDQLRAELARKG